MLNSVNYLFIYIKIEISSDDPVQIQPANQENAVTDQYTETTLGIFTISFEKPKKKRGKSPYNFITRHPRTFDLFDVGKFDFY